MITVLKGYKDGTRINRYECSNGEHTVVVTKEQLITYIQQGEVKNARIQHYQGRVIVRVENADVINSKEVDDYEVPTELKKLINIERFIRSYKDKGVDEIMLGDAKVNTETLNLTINNTVSSNEGTGNKLTKLQVQDIVEKHETKYYDLVYNDKYAYYAKCETVYAVNLHTEEITELDIDSYNTSEMDWTAGVHIIMHNDRVFVYGIGQRVINKFKGYIDLVWIEYKGTKQVNYKQVSICNWAVSLGSFLFNQYMNEAHIVGDRFAVLNLLNTSDNDYDIRLGDYRNRKNVEEDGRDCKVIVDVQENKIYTWEYNSNFIKDKYKGSLITGYRDDSLVMDRVDLLNIEETDDMLRLTLRNRYKDKLTNRIVSVYENNEKYIGSEDKYYTFKVNKNTGDVIVRLYSNNGDELDLTRKVNSITYK